jgi:hypothetical protein
MLRSHSGEAASVGHEIIVVGGDGVVDRLVRTQCFIFGLAVGLKTNGCDSVRARP